MRRNRLPTGCLVRKWRTWYCQWKFKGVPYQKSLETTIKADAETKMKSFMASVVNDISNGDFLLKYGAEAKKTQKIIPLPKSSNPDGDPLSHHLQAYLADLKIMGRDIEYIYITERRINKVFTECGWTNVGQVSADGFIYWRSSQTGKAPKTINDYLASASAFMTWMHRYGHIEKNPLAMIRKVETRGREVRVRRAYTAEELKLILAKATPIKQALYLMAVFTGLRKGELLSLRWGDLTLEGNTPFVRARASTTKNHMEATIGLHPDVVEALLKIRPSSPKEEALVFPFKQRSDTFRADLKKAGITLVDARGRRVDFHALRHTLATMLAVSGVQPRVAMEVMRHSDMRLTQKVYTDASLLPTLAAISSLPSLTNKSVVEPTIPPAVAMPDDELERTCKALLKELERRKKAS